jgi:hypothetical protein
VFLPGFGKDTISDFLLGHDILQIDHTIFGNVADLLAHATNDGSGNVVITASTNDSIAMLGTTVSMLQQHQNDFHIV